MITTTEAMELAALLADTNTPIEVGDVCDALRDAMDGLEETKAARDEATHEIKRQLAAALAPFDRPVAALTALIDVAKLRIALAVEEHDARCAAQIAARITVDAPFAPPKGVSVKRDTVITVLDASALDPDFFKRVPDVDLIAAAVGAGILVPGADVSTEIKVQLNRKHYGTAPQ